MRWSSSASGLRTKGRIQLAETVLVIGIGGLGVHAVQLAKALGARVIAVDITEDRLAGATRYGADAVIDGSQEDVPARVRELTGGEGADVAVEIVRGEAVPGVIQHALAALAPGGRLVVMGYAYGRSLSVYTAALAYGQWRLLGTRASAKQDLADVIRLVESGVITPVVARTFPIEAAAGAFESLRRDPPLGRIVLRS
ncbi:MAG: zinc-binding dehydrogenase [Candidatus Dormibacteraceae bacterium]